MSSSLRGAFVHGSVAEKILEIERKLVFDDTRKSYSAWQNPAAKADGDLWQVDINGDRNNIVFESLYRSALRHVLVDLHPLRLLMFSTLEHSKDIPAYSRTQRGSVLLGSNLSRHVRTLACGFACCSLNACSCCADAASSAAAAWTWRA